MRFLLLVGTLVAGCSSPSAAPVDMGQDGHGQPVCTPDGKAINLTGRFGVKASLVVNVKVTPGCVGAACIVDTDANAELLLITDVTQTGMTATAKTQMCKIVIPPVALKGGNMPVKLSAPSALAQSIAPVQSIGTLDGTTSCAHFSLAPITLALGANLASTTSDPLPGFNYMAMPPIPLCGGDVKTACLTATTPAPAQAGCVCDQDADGKPGGTLDAMNAPGFDDIDKAYVDLRTSVTLTGQVFPAGTAGSRVVGTVPQMRLDQNILGCHRAAPSGGAPRDCTDAETNTVAQLNPAITQSANQGSTFVAAPLDAAATCATLIAEEGTLFP